MTENINCCDKKIYEKVRNNWDRVAKPIDGLGDFERLICRIGAMTGNEYPDISKKALIIMCADNGIVEEGVSQTDQSVTKAVTEMMRDRKSSVGIMTEGTGLDYFVVDIGVNCIDELGVINRKVAMGTKNFLKESAMTEEQCKKAIQTGIDIVSQCKKQGYGIIATGEMGIGNTTTSTALMCALTGISPEEITGAGAGLSEEGIARKVNVIKMGLGKYGLADGATNEPLYALQSVGGLDIAGLTGVFIGAATNKVPVVIDGFISAVAALCAEMMAPGAKEYMIASHSGREKGTGIVLNRLGLKPVIYADMALGEGTGAVMMFPLLDMVYRLYSRGTGFADTEIDSYERYNESVSVGTEGK